VSAALLLRVDHVVRAVANACRRADVLAVTTSTEVRADGSLLVRVHTAEPRAALAVLAALREHLTRLEGVYLDRARGAASGGVDDGLVVREAGGRGGAA
jgi:hypothetical protein